MIFWFFSHISALSSGGFLSIDSLSAFFSQSPIIRLGGFSPATSLFDTYQLSYGAKMFSLVSLFSSSVFTGLRGFLPSSHSSSTIPRLAELTSEEGGNCNNISFGAESSQSGSYMTITNYNLTLSGLTSITTLGSFPSLSLSRQHLVLPRLRHKVNDTSTYKLKGYSVVTDAYRV